MKSLPELQKILTTCRFFGTGLVLDKNRMWKPKKGDLVLSQRGRLVATVVRVRKNGRLVIDWADGIESPRAHGFRMVTREPWDILIEFHNWRFLRPMKEES